MTNYKEVAREIVDKITSYSIVNRHGQLTAKENPDFMTWRNIIEKAIRSEANKEIK